MRANPMWATALPWVFGLAALLATIWSCAFPAHASAASPVDAIYHTAHVAGTQRGVNPDFLVCVASREASLRPEAVYRDWHGVVHYRGLYQFSAQTWPLAARLAGYDESIAGNWWQWAHDITVSTHAAAALMARADLGGWYHWPSTGASCSRARAVLMPVWPAWH